MHVSKGAKGSRALDWSTSWYALVGLFFWFFKIRTDWNRCRYYSQLPDQGALWQLQTYIAVYLPNSHFQIIWESGSCKVSVLEFGNPWYIFFFINSYPARIIINGHRCLSFFMIRELAWHSHINVDKGRKLKLNRPEIMGLPHPVSNKLEVHNCWLVSDGIYVTGKNANKD